MPRTAALLSSADVSAVVRPLCPQTKEPLTHELSEKYVYLYRDPETFEIRYVGKGTIRNGGKGKQRPEDHLRCRQETCRVRPWVDALRASGRNPVVEVLNCGVDAGRAEDIEAALISALKGNERDGLLNHHYGKGDKFRPLGSPQSVAGRRVEDPLSRAKIASMGPALVVNLSIDDFYEYMPGKGGTVLKKGRSGAGTFSDLTDRRVRERIREEWQIGLLRDGWLSGALPRPKVIIGVMGPASRKWIYGAMLVDQKRIEDMVRRPGNLYSMPVKDGVDAYQLRGRALAPYQFGPRRTSRGRVFNSIRSQQFDWVQ